MNFLAIIPSRYGSTRFPGKSLALLGGKPIVERVYERVARVFEHVCVATDDDRIMSAVAGFGGVAVLTSQRIAVAPTAAAKPSQKWRRRRA